MGKGKKVYLLTSGEYSDYQVLCAVSSKKTARKLAIKCDASVEVRRMYDDVGDVKAAHMLTITVFRNEKGPDGSPLVQSRHEFVFPWDYDVGEVAPYRSFTTYAAGDGRERSRYFKGTDHERVRKAASDYAAQIRAEREGLT